MPWMHWLSMLALPLLEQVISPGWLKSHLGFGTPSCGQSWYTSLEWLPGNGTSACSSTSCHGYPPLLPPLLPQHCSTTVWTPRDGLLEMQQSSSHGNMTSNLLQIWLLPPLLPPTLPHSPQSLAAFTKAIQSTSAPRSLLPLSLLLQYHMPGPPATMLCAQNQVWSGADKCHLQEALHNTTTKQEFQCSQLPLGYVPPFLLGTHIFSAVASDAHISTTVSSTVSSILSTTVSRTVLLQMSQQHRPFSMTVPPIIRLRSSAFARVFSAMEMLSLPAAVLCTGPMRRQACWNQNSSCSRWLAPQVEHLLHTKLSATSTTPVRLVTVVRSTPSPFLLLPLHMNPCFIGHVNNTQVLTAEIEHQVTLPFLWASIVLLGIVLVPLAVSTQTMTKWELDLVPPRKPVSLSDTERLQHLCRSCRKWKKVIKRPVYVAVALYRICGSCCRLLGILLVFGYLPLMFAASRGSTLVHHAVLLSQFMCEEGHYLVGNLQRLYQDWCGRHAKRVIRQISVWRLGLAWLTLKILALLAWQLLPSLRPSFSCLGTLISSQVLPPHGHSELSILPPVTSSHVPWVSHSSLHSWLTSGPGVGHEAGLALAIEVVITIWTVIFLVKHMLIFFRKKSIPLNQGRVLRNKPTVLALLAAAWLASWLGHTQQAGVNCWLWLWLVLLLSLLYAEGGHRLDSQGGWIHLVVLLCLAVTAPLMIASVFVVVSVRGICHLSLAASVVYKPQERLRPRSKNNCRGNGIARTPGMSKRQRLSPQSSSKTLQSAPGKLTHTCQRSMRRSWRGLWRDLSERPMSLKMSEAVYLAAFLCLSPNLALVFIGIPVTCTLIRFGLARWYCYLPSWHSLLTVAAMVLAVGTFHEDVSPGDCLSFPCESWRSRCVSCTAYLTIGIFATCIVKTIVASPSWTIRVPRVVTFIPAISAVCEHFVVHVMHTATCPAEYALSLLVLVLLLLVMICQPAGVNRNAILSISVSGFAVSLQMGFFPLKVIQSFLHTHNSLIVERMGICVFWTVMSMGASVGRCLLSAYSPRRVFCVGTHALSLISAASAVRGAALWLLVLGVSQRTFAVVLGQYVYWGLCAISLWSLVVVLPRVCRVSHCARQIAAMLGLVAAHKVIQLAWWYSSLSVAASETTLDSTITLWCTAVLVTLLNLACSSPRLACAGYVGTTIAYLVIFPTGHPACCWVMASGALLYASQRLMSAYHGWYVLCPIIASLGAPGWYQAFWPCLLLTLFAGPGATGPFYGLLGQHRLPSSLTMRVCDGHGAVSIVPFTKREAQVKLGNLLALAHVKVRRGCFFVLQLHSGKEVMLPSCFSHVTMLCIRQQTGLRACHIRCCEVRYDCPDKVIPPPGCRHVPVLFENRPNHVPLHVCFLETSLAAWTQLQTQMEVACHHRVVVTFDDGLSRLVRGCDAGSVSWLALLAGIRRHIHRVRSVTVTHALKGGALATGWFSNCASRNKKHTLSSQCMRPAVEAAQAAGLQLTSEPPAPPAAEDSRGPPTGPAHLVRIVGPSGIARTVLMRQGEAVESLAQRAVCWWPRASIGQLLLSMTHVPMERLRGGGGSDTGIVTPPESPEGNLPFNAGFGEPVVLYVYVDNMWSDVPAPVQSHLPGVLSVATTFIVDHKLVTSPGYVLWACPRIRADFAELANKKQTQVAPCPDIKGCATPMHTRVVPRAWLAKHPEILHLPVKGSTLWKASDLEWWNPAAHTHVLNSTKRRASAPPPSAAVSPSDVKLESGQEMLPPLPMPPAGIVAASASDAEPKARQPIRRWTQKAACPVHVLAELKFPVSEGMNLQLDQPLTCEAPTHWNGWKSLVPLRKWLCS